MTDLPPWRLNLIRIAYAIMATGIGLYVWPSLLSHRLEWPLMNGVVSSLLAGMSLFALLGLRHPLKMLPLLLFELTWKTLWLALVALPLWRAGLITPRIGQTVFECSLAVILLPLIPWDHVWRSYVAAPGAPWRRARPA